MSTDDRVVYRIVAAARAVHGALGPGFMESIYGRALSMELKDGGFRVEREKTMRVWYKSAPVGKHRLDLLIDGAVIVELKANRGIIPVHVSQMRSYLHASMVPFGLLLNFGTTELEWEVICKTKNPDEP